VKRWSSTSCSRTTTGCPPPACPVTTTCARGGCARGDVDVVVAGPCTPCRSSPRSPQSWVLLDQVAAGDDPTG
jgi:hypothetical protein